MAFRDRREAGRRLGDALRARCDLAGAVVLGLPRGGVPVAIEVARAIAAPLDVCVVRKLGVPWHPELAMGAIASGGVRVLNDDVIAATGIEPEIVDRVAQREAGELRRREEAYRSGRAAVPVTGATVVLVDDGLATGASMRAAAQAARARGARRVVVAVPVAPSATCERLAAVADEVICLETPAFFFGVGQFYADFRQTTDAEVVAALSGHAPDAAATNA